jgi:hypothetical protein
MVSNNIKAGLATLFFGSLGDLASRVMWLNCSVDSSWTLFFAIPPISIVSAIMYFFGKVESGVNPCGDSFDWFLILIPIITILTESLAKEFIESKTIFYIITFLVLFAMYGMIRIYKANKMCKQHFKEQTEKRQGFNWNLVKRGLFLSLITNVIIFSVDALAPYGISIPFVGKLVKFFKDFDYVPGLKHAAILTFVHFYMNLKENIKPTLENVCIKDDYTIFDVFKDLKA